MPGNKHLSTEAKAQEFSKMYGIAAREGLPKRLEDAQRFLHLLDGELRRLRRGAKERKNEFEIKLREEPENVKAKEGLRIENEVVAKKLENLGKYRERVAAHVRLLAMQRGEGEAEKEHDRNTGPSIYA